MSFTSELTASLGGDSAVGAILLFNSNVVDAGSGVAATWQCARGGSYPTVTFASGARPTIDPTGLIFTGSEYGHIASSLGMGADNWAIIAIHQMYRNARVDGTNPMVAGVGDGSGSAGYAMTTNAAGGVDKIGGLLYQVAWLGSSQVADGLTQAGTSAYDVRVAQVFNRKSGSTYTRLNGTDISSAAANVPNAPDAHTYVGWDNEHNKYKGIIQGLVLVNANPGNTGLDNATTLLNSYFDGTWTPSGSATTTQKRTLNRGLGRALNRGMGG